MSRNTKTYIKVNSLGLVSTVQDGTLQGQVQANEYVKKCLKYTEVQFRLREKLRNLQNAKICSTETKTENQTKRETSNNESRKS